MRITTGRLWGRLRRLWHRALPPATATVPLLPPSTELEPLERIVLTDGVSNTLFDQYAEHRRGARGKEETGWVLMGRRQGCEAVALAVLPAGSGREAGVAHVRFNSLAQTVASRIVRQRDRQLGILGVVHTHPGSLRHPSSGDLAGDREWVRLLRGTEGVFAIGTVDKERSAELYAVQPKPHVQCYRGLRLDWYALAAGDEDYRPLAVTLTNGPDLAAPLHAVWDALERHAPRLDNLCRKLQRVQFDVRSNDDDAALVVSIPAADDEKIVVVMCGEKTEYLLQRGGQWLAAECSESRIDHGVFTLLAELAR